MSVRKMKLPEGWYPHDKKGIEEFIREWNTKGETYSNSSIAGIVPHAGWYFSGRSAWNIISRIPANCTTVIIAGGHLHSIQNSICWNDDEYETPLGPLKLNNKLFNLFCGDLDVDSSPDNTIEIQLPLIKYNNPEVEILPVRLSPVKDSFFWGEKIGSYCRANGIKAFFLGSTDLTHYGASYGNLQYENNGHPVQDACNQDRKLMEYLVKGDYDKSIDSVEKWQTACSVGGALGAAGFAKSFGKIPGTIQSLTGSYEKIPDKSNFVNYGSILF